jgi:hypothetical protein
MRKGGAVQGVGSANFLIILKNKKMLNPLCKITANNLFGAADNIIASR